MNAPVLRFRDEEGRAFPEWVGKRLGQIATFSKGKGISKSDIDANGKTLCIRYGELYTDYGTTIKSVKSKTNVNLKMLILSEANDVIIPASGETQIDIATASCVQLSGVALGGDLNIIKSQGDGVFLAYYLNSQKKLDIAKLAQGNSVVHLYSSQLKLLELKLPLKAEQTKIANFLTAVDEKISQLTQKHALLTQYKKGVMQQIFSQTLRFKDDDGREFPEWEEKDIGEIFKVTRGNVLAMPLVSGTPTDTHKFPVYSSQTKNNGLSGYYNEYLFENCITWTTDGANAGDVNFRSGKFYCTNVCGVLVNSDGYANACVAAMINAVSRKYVSYVGNPKLMNGVMAKITIEFPCVAEQTKISQFLTALDDKLAATLAQLDGVKQYKQGLLQQMFV